MLRGGKRARFSSRVAVKTPPGDLSYKLPVLKKMHVCETDERGTLGEATALDACYCSKKTPEALVRRDGLCWHIGLEVLTCIGWPIPLGPAVRLCL